jgi:hypothetical protein
MTTTVRQRFKLSPSDLTFLWKDCRRCFYDKCHGIAVQPRLPMPSVFTRIDRAMRDFFEPRGTAWLSPTLPPGTVDCRDRFLTSEAIAVPGYSETCYLRGKTDCLLRFDDGTFGVVDFKTANPSDGQVELYIRQLWAYAYCMEHPEKPSELMAPVAHMGLLCFEPGEMQMLIGQGPTCLLHGRPVWKPRTWDEGAFIDFLGGVMDVLTGGTPPPDESCKFCLYRMKGVPA